MKDAACGEAIISPGEPESPVGGAAPKLPTPLIVAAGAVPGKLLVSLALVSAHAPGRRSRDPVHNLPKRRDLWPSSLRVFHLSVVMLFKVLAAGSSWLQLGQSSKTSR